MKILADAFPHGKKAALTMSYDDGLIYDRRLVEIFNQNHIKGTFHLNSELSMRQEWERFPLEEIPALYKGHEVSCHSATHPFPKAVPDTTWVNEIIEDRRRLEAACGYTVRGMSYPNGGYSDHAIEILRACGMRYSRTTRATNSFAPPEDFMKWHPTTHHKGDLIGLFDSLMERTKRCLCHDILYIWGHSYEFNNNNNWNIIENFCAYAKDREELWYATNIELYDYITASRALMVGVDGKTVYNPSAVSVWVHADGELCELKPGENRL